MLAQILFTALKGTVVNVTGVSPSYDGVENRVHDPVQETRRELKHDRDFRKMKDEAREIRERIMRRKEGEWRNSENEGGFVQALQQKLKEISDYTRGK